MPKIFLPSVKNESGVSGESSPADELFDLFAGSPLQQRAVCIWHPLLAQAAQSHAEDMLHRGYFSHTSPEGVWSNKRVRITGYRLVDWFRDDTNNVESIGAGYATVGELWQAWLLSPMHRLHVLGEQSYGIQINVGVGYAAQVGAPLFGVTWVLVSAPPEV